MVFVLCLNICILLFAQPALAASNTNTIYSNIEKFEDGSYIIDEIVIIPNNTDFSLLTNTKSTTAVRNSIGYDSLGKKCWTFSLTATFQYNGSISKTQTASCNYTIHQNGWNCKSKNATYSGNTAKGSASFKCSTTTFNTTIGLKCSALGKISNINY